MGIDEKKEVLLFVGAIFALLIIGSNFSTTGNASKDYTCVDSDGLSTLIQGEVTYRNSGVASERTEKDYCLEEGKAGSLVHEFWCAERTMQESNFACAYTQKCMDGRCVDLS